MLTADKKARISGTEISFASLAQCLWKNVHEIIFLLDKEMKIINIKGLEFDTSHLIEQSITTLLPFEQLAGLNQTLITGNPISITFNAIKNPLICYLQRLLDDKKKKTVGYLLIGNVEETLDELRSRARIAEQKYLDTSLLLQNIVDAAPGLIYWKDLEGRYLGVNKYWCQSLGFNLSQVIGEKDEKFWPSVAPRLRENDRLAMEVEITIQKEERTYNSALGEIIFMSFKSPLRDSHNNIIGVIGTSLDITELKKNQHELELAKERAETANRTKDNFIAIISHEIRTPMNIILGMAQILNSKNWPKDQQQSLDIILTSGKNLLDLINDILDYSKLEAHKLEIKPGPVNVTKLLNEIINTIQHRIAEKPINLCVDFQDSIPKWVLGDEMRLRQIILNLLTNAVKFTESGQIKLTIQAIPKNKHTLFKIIVADTGVGIAQEHLKLIFERFMQVDSYYNRRFQGTGLGLSIVKSLVEAMKGKIGVESELGKGSSFWFTLPLKHFYGEEPMVEEPVPEPVIEFKRAYAPKILVVEDNKLNQKVINFMLQEFNCIIDLVESGEEAIALFKENTYHLVFMDIGLPGMNGLDVTKALRHTEAGKIFTPIIALTAHAAERDQANCIKAGANNVLTKPVMRNELIKILNEYCPK